MLIVNLPTGKYPPGHPKRRWHGQRVVVAVITTEESPSTIVWCEALQRRATIPKAWLRRVHHNHPTIAENLRGMAEEEE